MFKNYFKAAIRNLRRNKVYTLLNLAGLSIGLTVFILVLLFVNYEKSYDSWNKELSQVYRVGVSEEKDGEIEKSPSIQYPLGTFLLQDCPEVVALSRARVIGEQLISLNEKEFFEKNAISADSNFFKLFPYHFIRGNRLTVLNEPNTMVISKKMSKKLFGNTDPIGKTVTVNLKTNYTITGVIEKQGPSHLDFDMCLSYHSQHFAGNWFMKNQDTYVLLKPSANLNTLTQKASKVYGSNYALSYIGDTGGEPGKSQGQSDKADPITRLAQKQGIKDPSVFFEPVKSIHLHPKGYLSLSSKIPVYDFSKSNAMPVYIFSLIGFLVLLLACINYTNMSIAQASGRLKASGIRKIVGASRRQLITQFLVESLVLCGAALIIALTLTRISANALNQSLQLNLQLWNQINPAQNRNLVIQLIIIFSLTTLVSGIYPAFVLSKYNPLNVVKGNTTLTGGNNWLRNALVVFQFAIAGTFIIGVLTIYLQLKFMHENDPGFKTDQVLRVEALGTYLFPGQPGDKSQFIIDKLMKIPGVKMVSSGDNYPGMPGMSVQEVSYDGNKTISAGTSLINYHYFQTMGMKIMKGRDFSSAFGMDSVNAAVINQTAASKMGWENPVGKLLDLMGKKYQVIGVIKDAYLRGYKSEVTPEIYMIGVENPMNFTGHKEVFIKMNGQGIQKTLVGVISFWKTLQPKFPVRYSWLDQDFARLFAKYDRFSKLTGLLAVVAIAIAMLGLFALSAFSAKQRIKEIGVRKVLGASVKDIVQLLSGNYILLVLIAFMISLPIAIWSMNNWLHGFAYRISIHWWMVGLAGLAMLAVALISVGYQSIKAAIANPVDSLRSE